MKSTKLIYVMRKFDFAAVSQVGELLLHYQQAGNFDQLYLLVSSMGDIAKHENQLDKLRRADIRIFFYKDISFLHRNLSFLQIRSIARILSEIVVAGHESEYLIHTRNVLVAHFAKEAKKRIPNLNSIPILADFRGTEWAEYLLFTHMNIPFIRELVDAIETRELLLIEQDIYKTAELVSVVSPDFRQYLAMMWGSRDGVFINPCIAQTSMFDYDSKLRKTAREQQGLSPEDIVLLFSTGGASPWQNIAPIIDTFTMLREKCSVLGNALKLFILTPASDQFSDIHEAVTIKSAVPEEMNKWLNLADIGIIFRDENVVNYVASPIKVSEYLCSGLPLITNRGVPMAVKWASDRQFGTIVDSLSDLTEDTLAELKQADREMISGTGQENYGLAAVAGGYETMYSSLLDKRGSLQ